LATIAGVRGTRRIVMVYGLGLEMSIPCHATG